MICDKTGKCKVFLLYELSRGWLDYQALRMILDTPGICMVSRQYGFSCDSSEYYLGQMISGITGKCMAFLRYMLLCGVWWSRGTFVALQPEGCGFESTSSRRVGTLGKSFTHHCS